ncbi:phytoene desaturase family protein [Nocardioides donggukensis]|uniref:NAD(P)/FAD-dependent oxidoreductase n=1 Tax=Nocardioides donggukensis TaxID=2774019 RepID=A0A927K3A5_9ACTN|nr:NAD(P)/FAD-dependent oxidoreductase [Nocardioides donggukensis]MBD8869197.1 NAD(P)/FAD-dependent oxidoreductase [Nocardioides donggukensis]
MARVVVVGGGFGGLASAARLAKQGHEVTLVERREELGGALGSISADGFTWDTGPTHTLLPAVLRDLFRKTGRPLERELDLVPQETVREHWFEDDTRVRLPGGSRAAQLRAFDELAPGLGQQWCDHVASFADDWEVLRREVLERPWERELADPAVTARVFTRETLGRRLRRTFRDERLRLVAAHPFVADGHDPRNVPVWLGMQAYLEQNFGAWTVPGEMGGMGRVATVLAGRMATRGVTVHTGTGVTDIELRAGRAVAVATTQGEVAADHVVCAIDPRALPALAAYARRTMPAIPPVVCHLGLSGDVPDLAPETVLHGDPMLVVRTGGQAPEGGHAWTVHGRGKLAEDVVVALARAGLDVRTRIEVRVDRSPRALVQEWGQSPHGALWQGRATLKERIGTRTPVPNVYAAGAYTAFGPGLPYVGLSAALVAQAIGPA